MSVTIKQVAKEAEVSIATVSRVFNGKGPVSEDTRQRVIRVAERLRYVPHGGARSLITRQTRTIGVLLPDIHGEFFSELIRGIDQAARKARYHLLVSGAHSDTGGLEAALRATRGRVDGLIVMVPDVDIDAGAIDRSLVQNLPVVLLDAPRAGSLRRALVIDNYGGAFAMTRHLLGLGHRSIAFVTGPHENLDAAERLRGFRAAIAAAPSEIRASEIGGDFTQESGFAAARAIMAHGPLPGAMFASNDAMAVGALSAFREAGIDVPRDIALAGFDDIPIARFLTPPLTTVHVPIAQFGALAVEKLMEGLHAGPLQPRGQDLVPTQLIVRTSCGAGQNR